MELTAGGAFSLSLVYQYVFRYLTEDLWNGPNLMTGDSVQPNAGLVVRQTILTSPKHLFWPNFIPLKAPIFS